jgi:murein DD-endopeptidase MepM/ murein hydrolase activator NlpD
MTRMSKTWTTSFVGTALAMLLLATAHASAPTQDIQLDGDFVQGGLLFGKAPAASRVFWGGREVRTTPAGDYVIGLGRDNRTPMMLKVQMADGKEQQQVFDIAKRDYKMQEITGISSKIMSPSKEDLQRINQENSMIGKARKVDSDRTEFLRPFVWPLNGPITGVFGSQRVYNGVPSRPHFGVDVAAPTGTPARAPAGGVVILAHDNMFYSGGTLMIDHGYGLNSSFLHLSKILVKVGDEVRQGQVVAEVGATGRVTGAHLDWRMNWYDQRIDPQLLVGDMPAADKSGQNNTGGSE